MTLCKVIRYAGDRHAAINKCESFNRLVPRKRERYINEEVLGRVKVCSRRETIG
jgi:hypothetical protein